MAYIFISYSHQDKKYCHRLKAELKEQGFEVWIDDRIDYGTRWPDEIQQRLDGCAALVVIMTPRSYASDWVQNELARAKRKGKPVFPLLLEGDAWLSVEATQYVDVRGAKLPPAGFYSRLAGIARPKPSLVQAGKPQSAVKLPTPTVRTEAPAPVKVVPVPPLARDLHVIDKPIRLELIHIPSGEFLMGDDKQRIEVAEFYISRYPITNAQFAKFVQAKKYERPSHWGAGGIPAGKENHPVVYVSWHNTVAFCDWLSEATGRRFRLPTEAEWEKAARGGLRIPQKVFTLSATAAWRKMLSTDLRIPSYGDALRDNPLPGRQYPWGNEIDKNKCNTYESGIRDTTPVGKYSPAGDSPYGVADMAGNVWEWTQEIVLRGGSSRNVHGDAAAPVRRSGTPDSRSDVFGFRVCAVLLPP